VGEVLRVSARQRVNDIPRDITLLFGDVDSDRGVSKRRCVEEANDVAADVLLLVVEPNNTMPSPRPPPSFAPDMLRDDDNRGALLVFNRRFVGL
jgi:hypothetical protein